VKIIVILSLIVVIAGAIGISMSMRKSSGPSMSSPPTPPPTTKPTPQPTTPPLLGCYSSTAEINDKEIVLEDTSVPREYHICPNSVFEMETNPLDIIHPNFTVMCGDDGKSSNNCTFKGGLKQIQMSQVNITSSKPHASLENITIQGITFTSSTGSNIQVLEDGLPVHFTVKDCIFNKNDLYYNIFIEYDNSSLVVEDSKFTENTININEGLPFSACIFSITAPSVTIRNCEFLDNTSNNNVGGYTVATILLYDDKNLESNGEFDTRLNITDSCFQRNLRNTHSLVLTDDKTYYSRNNLQAGNLFSLPATDLSECPGIGDPLDKQNGYTFECKEKFNLGGCA